MTAVILTIHSLIVLALIGVVLLQRSDGGALGIGGGGSGGFMTGRGAANALTRTTAILATLFFATSLLLAIRAGAREDAGAVIDELTGSAATVEEPLPSADGSLSTEAILNSLGAADAASEPESAQELLGEQGADAPETENAESAAETPADSDETPEEAPNN